MSKMLAIVLLLPLSGCLEQRDSFWVPSDIAPMFGGGGSAPAPARPAPGYNGQPLSPGASKMLEDPEAESTEQSEEVWATSPEEAQKRCQQIAAQMTRQGGTVVTVRGVSRINSKKFFCQFRVETGGQ